MYPDTGDKVQSYFPVRRHFILGIRRRISNQVVVEHPYHAGGWVSGRDITSPDCLGNLQEVLMLHNVQGAMPNNVYPASAPEIG